ncbi:winged helix-turn-helix transcriptional regulator [Candidatus Nitrosocosmicus hydrocola]|uniref:winged helix-turn-helix transcriptional regulator n=1 Tax=Candidatus Nitrosocosmicus hydrocola TaxID=1826872 RepID=UPI000AFDADB3|nr:helix-turn-helix domain-containing protein [Candidatus Nitrosocosmicus hydrocola]
MKSSKLTEQNDFTNRKSKLPILDDNYPCNFHGYDIENLMKETSTLREIVTRRGTLEILIPLCCSTDPVRYNTFRKSMKGFSSKTLTVRLRELEKNGILERKYFNEIPPRVEYRLTQKGQELTESIINLLQWMRKWSIKKDR